MLEDISCNVDAPIANRIAWALKGRLPEATTAERPDCPSSDSTSSVGSLRDVDNVNEDLNWSEASRATGYIGKSSEVAWMQRLVTEAMKEEQQQNDQYPSLFVDDSIASVNYHLDDEPLHELDVKNIFSLPPKSLGDKLLNTYLDHVHDSLPIIRRSLFQKQYDHVFSGDQLNPGRKWLAVLNMIFAIGSQTHRLSGQDTQSDDDEKIYFGRAKSLNISENVLYDHADLQQIQAEALMALYLLNLSQVNRIAFANLVDRGK
ncbi:hypothetical protein LTR66_013548 [Elasticomyces elasticus]|nr:hypothetical protein LTR66_013548 [Elasticomyces elasticus]